MTPQQIRQWRHDHKFAPVELADALGVARNTIYRWESGAMEPLNGLAERLEIVLAQREVARAAQPPVVVDPAVFAIESYQPYGTVIGLKRSFWMAMTDQERVDWVNEADNPTLALPWPWWSHGYDYYPGGKIIGHYLLRSHVATLARRVKHAQGATDLDKLRNVVIRITRDEFTFWMQPNRSTLDEEGYATLRKIMDAASGEPATGDSTPVTKP
jgi:transcriptional regulator with XRE-family HTH domain